MKSTRTQKPRTARHASPAPKGSAGRAAAKPGSRKAITRKAITPKTRPYRPPGALAFPDVRGKTLADLYLMADSEFSSITLRFDDNTEIFFSIDIESSLVVDADYSDWTTGNQRFLKRWPARRLP